MENLPSKFANTHANLHDTFRMSRYNLQFAQAFLSAYFVLLLAHKRLHLSIASQLEPLHALTAAQKKHTR